MRQWCGIWNCDGRTWRSVGSKACGDSEMSRHEIIVVYKGALSTKLMSLIKFNDGFVNWGFWKRVGNKTHNDIVTWWWTCELTQTWIKQKGNGEMRVKCLCKTWEMVRFGCKDVPKHGNDNEAWESKPCQSHR